MQKKEEREKLFKEFLSIENDLSYDWFTDYFQSEHSDRKHKKQDFTPDGIVTICNNILGKTTSNADICAGTGGLTIKRWSSNKDATFYCEEFSDRAMPFLLFNLAIRNVEGYVKHGDSLENTFKSVYKLSKGDEFSDIEIVEDNKDIGVDTVIMNPPYSMQWKQKKDDRFLYGVAPKSKSDYAFLLHGFNKLKDNGKMAIILPHGVLFRGSAEGVIRKNLIDNNHLDTVIGLPGKAFMNTDIPTVILVLKKTRDIKDILFIDAKDEYTKDKSINVIESEHINKIIDAFKKRKTIDKFSNVCGVNDIVENDYNLNIPRYVDTYEPEEVVPLEVIMEDLIDVEKEILEQKQQLATMMLDLVGTDEESDRTIKSFAKTFADMYGTRAVVLPEIENTTKEEKKEGQVSLFD